MSACATARGRKNIALVVIKKRRGGVSTGVVPNAEDAALVEHALAGDSDAFALLYYRYRLDVWNMAYFRLRNHHETEDVVQETFVRAHRALAQHGGSGTALRPWLLAICRNACTDRVRASRRRPLISLDDERIDEPTAAFADHDQRIDFDRALGTLPAEEAEAFFVVDVLGFRSEEAARILGLRASSTLRSRLARARRALAPLFADPPQLVEPPAEESAA
jgi:RNA polymerase sigma-70 factor (ECF subfamily)